MEENGEEEAQDLNKQEEADQEEDKESETEQVEEKEVLEQPKTIIVGEPTFDIDFHPVKDYLAAGLINGEILIYNYRESSAKKKLVHKFSHHLKSCRALEFSKEGRYLFSGSLDKSFRVVDMQEGELCFQKFCAHPTGINALLSHGYNLYTGDDNGLVKAWDMRQAQAIFSFEDNEDYISEFAYSKSCLFAMGGDGYLCVYDLRKGTLRARSDNIEDELLCGTFVAGGKNLLTGTEMGNVYIWNWGDWGYFRANITGHPHYVEALLSIDERTVCSGASDGRIRVMDLTSRRICGIVGEQKHPVQSMDLSHDRKFIASCGYGKEIKFWNVEYIEKIRSGKKYAKAEQIEDDDFDDSELNKKHTLKRMLPGAKKKTQKRSKKKDNYIDNLTVLNNPHLQENKRRRNFFADLKDTDE